jgi:NADH-quinone oxidoreductase subunit N
MSLIELQALLPQLILALGGTAILLLGAWISNRRLWLLTGMGIALLAALTAGLLEPPLTEVAGMYGTGLYARFCTILWALIIAATLLLSCRYADLHRFGGGEYASLLLFAGAGMSLLSAATSLVGLFLGLEAFTLVLYILIAFNRTDNRGAEAGLKYLVFGAVATGFLAFGIALIYTATGSLHFQEALAGLQVNGTLRPLGLAGWAMLLVAIGFKISLVPFHLWTPDVYQGAPAPISGLLATAAKGAVVTALLPLLAGLGEAGGAVRQALWLLAILTMLVGTLAALPQTNLKRMLAYSSVVHMGYLLIALLAGGPAGGQALLFYLVVYSCATFGAFGVVTSLALENEEIQEYDEMRGLGYLHPRRSSALAAFLLSLAGIPPLAGFFGKFGIFHAALRNGYPELAIIGILTSLVSLYYYLRPIIVLFMQERSAYQFRQGCREEFILLAGCFAAILILGVYPGPLLELVARALP